MYRTILVPLDGTPFGEHALPPAIALARQTGARLHLTHVHVPEHAAVAAADAGLALAAYSYGSPAADGYLARLRTHLVAAGVPVEAEVLDGPVAPTLADAAEAFGADLVVLATHARTGLSRLVHRCAAAFLTRHLSVPVLLVREGAAAPGLEATPPFRHLLLPLDGTPRAERVLPVAATLGRALDARVTLLRVLPPPIEIGYSLLGQDGHVNDYLLNRHRDGAERYLERVAARLRTCGLSVAARVTIASDAAEGVLRFVDTPPQDLPPVDAVVMETSGLGGMAHLLDEGIVARVLSSARVPVLAHHGTAPVLAAEPDWAPETFPAQAAGGR
jgi:nucleotide-binding universal stress UspA family protein